ncbi:MAG: proline--tRNA ligase [Bifidobacteriaceae bacterium]|jgi:prolyl-tRNA synthetase|nr:proline--tRNA ligase [Bifidobacteriaceae bacterium]
MSNIIRLTDLFFKTLREDPASAETPGHKLLTRASYIRRVAPGIYTFLPLGLKVLKKIEKIIREEENSIGSQEVLFPALLPKEPFEATGRWTEYGDELFRLQDRKESNMLLAPTHEEMFTLLVKDIYSSYKELPTMLYQIQTKYRDEARPRAGLIRCREFSMMDAYSFDLSDKGLEASYKAQRDAYKKVFDRLGLEYVIVQATSGAMGGSKSEEFLHPSSVGEDTYVISDGGYAANVEAITIAKTPNKNIKADNAKSVSTPNATSIEDVCSFLKNQGCSFKESDFLKAIVVKLTSISSKKSKIVTIFIPGDRQLDTKRAEAFFAGFTVEIATDEQIKESRLVKGFIGPNKETQNYYDPRVANGSVWITGGNKIDTHIINMQAGRDFEVENIADVANIVNGDLAPDNSGKLTLKRGIEIGHIFALGKKYSNALELNVLDENGKSQTVTMGSYGIGVSRVLACLAETASDQLGLSWPKAVAPALVHIVAAGKDEKINNTAEKIANELDKKNIESILDTRKVSPGVKFKDAELLGVPYILTVGKLLEDGIVEIKNRDGSNLEKVSTDKIVAYIENLNE